MGETGIQYLLISSHPLWNSEPWRIHQSQRVQPPPPVRNGTCRMDPRLRVGSLPLECLRNHSRSALIPYAASECLSLFCFHPLVSVHGHSHPSHPAGHPWNELWKSLVGRPCPVHGGWSLGWKEAPCGISSRGKRSWERAWLPGPAGPATAAAAATPKIK